jgi:hypothetical protein
VTVVRYAITGGYVFVDADDVPHISKLVWFKVKSKNTFYARAKITRNGIRTSINMQNFITGSGSTPTDHRDRNGLNNVRSNLRVLTHFQNLQNCAGRGGRSRFKGVSVFYTRKTDGVVTYRATIAGETIGLFKDEIEAAKAYDEAAFKRFGVTAFQNALEYGL